jgi:hypothetical protein
MARNPEQGERGTLFQADVGPFRDGSAGAKSLSGFASSYSIRWLKIAIKIFVRLSKIFSASRHTQFTDVLLPNF